LCASFRSSFVSDDKFVYAYMLVTYARQHEYQASFLCSLRPFSCVFPGACVHDRLCTHASTSIRPAFSAHSNPSSRNFPGACVHNRLCTHASTSIRPAFSAHSALFHVFSLVLVCTIGYVRMPARVSGQLSLLTPTFLHVIFLVLVCTAGYVRTPA
jgi:hypothetical protein